MNDQQRSAMQHGTEALETELKAYTRAKLHAATDKCVEAIIALREALAQPPHSWIELTDDEVAELINEKVFDNRMTYQGLIRSVSDKLKEKNGV